ncbi:MAG: 7TM-DISM domain-containing protein [Leptospiraceae bacterium]|nr:7TM-DISM domain-containing protein [Leptospiraceae bacterium]MCZ8346501.1 7TM-DISM domain-containing protein [Leptospiraceae bacterium]
MRILNFLPSLSICFLLVTNCFTNQESISSNADYSDLSDLSWEDQIPVNLSENWEFYWKQLVYPDTFSQVNVSTKPTAYVPFRLWTSQKIKNEYLPAKGYATYRMKIKVQKDNEEQQFSVFFAHPFSASKLFINGRPLFEVGKVSANLDEMVPLRLNTLVEFSTKEQYLDIVIHFSNRDYFRGGPRGQFLLASAKQMHRYQMQNNMSEIVIFGLIFGAFIYHLAFFILNRKHVVFLYFSLLCLTFLIRIPLINSKLYLFFFPVIPTAIVTNLIHFIDIFSLLAANQFLIHLFQRKRIPFISEGFLLGGIIAFFSPLFPGFWKYYFNLYYVIGFVILFFIHSALLLYLHREEKQVHYLMGIGLFGLSVSCYLAIFLNLYGASGGIYLIIGYAIYVTFQSISLSKYFSYAIESRANIELQMQEQNLRALSKQREEMQLMVHDNLGAGLTDLKILMDREIVKSKSNKRSFLYGLRGRLNSILVSLRANLLEIEDLNLLYENFLTGLNLKLLRRYSEIGREINLQLTDSMIQHFHNLKISPANRDFYINLYYIFYEVCTNDLKYGMGETEWSLSFVNGDIHFIQRNQSQNKIGKETPVLKSITTRLSLLDGRATATIRNSIFELEIFIPKLES